MIPACKRTCSFQTVIEFICLYSNYFIWDRSVWMTPLFRDWAEINVKQLHFESEPGYYEKGQFGIRIEDIVQIVPAKVENDFNGRKALTFKTVTMCPIHTKLINKDLLTATEVTYWLSFIVHCSIFTLIYDTNFSWNFISLQRNHLNDYHAKVRETLKPLLEQEADHFTIQWLEKETQPI